GDTICAEGTPYSFFVRYGNSNNLLIFFQGGGACWNNFTCFTLGTSDVDVQPGDSPAFRPDGIFDLDNPENPFRDYNMVYIPYCTGDVHTGTSLTFYGDDQPIYHMGYTNAQAALAWTFENFPDPDRVFNSGCSAGSLGTIFHSPTVLAQYGDVPVVTLGDAAGGYAGDAADLLAAWGTIDSLAQMDPDFASATPNSLTFPMIYSGLASQYPDATFAQVNTAHDLVQAAFLVLIRGPRYEVGLEENLANFRTNIPDFRSYTGWGAFHCLTPSEFFYSFQVEGVRLRDWVAALAAGEEVDDVQCVDCEGFELYLP
ncbi:MAG: hypothetical protein GYB65_10465, partial [Chloroflexi bacterium]|nr:hypothetical protein [Chloroflexota bacterium]